MTGDDPWLWQEDDRWLWQEDEDRLVLRARKIDAVDLAAVHARLADLADGLVIARYWLEAHGRRVRYIALDTEWGETWEGEGRPEPWSAAQIGFWTAAARMPEAHMGVLRITALAALLLHRLNKAGQSAQEDDETQFAEVMVTALAFADPAFAAEYVRLLRLWDMEHSTAFHRGGMNARALVEKLGDRPEAAQIAAVGREHGFLS